ncbi:MAG TPA: hypothetical protein VJ990_08855 [Clostridia bacterium]|nr:hypothetical protein [Clostridia bacterium]
MEFVIPEYGTYNIKNIVFDFNGTIAEGGLVELWNLEKLVELSKDFSIHVITADTFGSVNKIFEGLPVKVKIISRETGAKDKEKFIEELGCEETIAVGNGFNDRFMLKASALGFCIAGPEGASVKAMMNSDVVVCKIEDFFSMIDEPKRLVATLRG